MARQKLCLASLTLLDNGIVNAAFNAALKRCEEDCADRPGEEKVRKVTLTLEVTPVRNQRGQLDSVNVGADVAESIPKRRSKLFNMLPTPDGSMFDELSVEDAHQDSLAIDGEDES